MDCTVNVTLDEKGRVHIPSKFHDALDAGFMIAKHIDRNSSVVCLKIYTKSAWDKFINRLDDFPDDIRSSIIRGIDRHKIEPKSGRFLIPSSLRKYARLEGEITMVGDVDTAELWNKEEYEKNILSIADIAKLYYGLD